MPWLFSSKMTMKSISFYDTLFREKTEMHTNRTHPSSFIRLSQVHRKKLLKFICRLIPTRDAYFFCLFQNNWKTFCFSISQCLACQWSCKIPHVRLPVRQIRQHINIWVWWLQWQNKAENINNREIYLYHVNQIGRSIMCICISILLWPCSVSSHSVESTLSTAIVIIVFILCDVPV